MKIAVVMNGFPNPSETFFLDQLVGLIDHGHHVTIFARHPPAGQPQHPEVAARQLIARTRYQPELPANKLRRVVKAAGLFGRLSLRQPRIARTLDPRLGREALSLRLFYAACPFATESDFDVIHCHYGPNGRLAVMLRELGLLSGPILTSFHGFDLKQVPRWEGTGYYRTLLRQGEGFTVGSAFAKKLLLEQGFPEDRITIQRVGVPLAQFPLRERKWRKDEPLILLSIARLTEVKGLRYSIQAVGALLDRYPALQYWIVGDGPLRATLSQQIRRLGASGRIQLLGWKPRDALQRILGKAHLFVHSCAATASGEEEGQGLALQEAQAVGLPVIATHHGALPEGMLPGKSGYLVAERDVSALEQQLGQLIEHPGSWSEMGRAGRRFVEDNFDAERQTERLIELLQRVASAP